jgi:hypothetical protein
MSLQDDLARWEAGYLSREELIASYASSERNLAEPFEKNLEKNLERNLEKNLVPDVTDEPALAKILDLHERLLVIGNEPVPYHESDWEQLRDSLPDRLPTRRVFGTGRLARPFIAASMVVGLTAGAAAASPAVREQMVSIWHGIERNIGLVDAPSQVEHRAPITASPHAPGDPAVGRPIGTTGPGNSGDNPGNTGTPGNSDGTTGGGNTGSPGNSDGTTGGGNTGSPGSSDGTTGGGNTGSPGSSDGTTGGGNSDNSGQGNGGTDNPGQGNGGTDNPGQGNGGTDNPGQGTGGTGNPGQGTGGTDNPGQGTGGTDNPGQGTGGTDNTGQGTGGTDNPGQGTGGTDPGDPAGPTGP